MFYSLVLIVVLVILLILYSRNRKYKKMLLYEVDNAKKMKEYLLLYDQWLLCNQKGYSIIDYFIENDIKSIAIYGYWILGPRLYRELKGTNVSVKYIIDRNAANIWAEIDVLTPDMDFPDVDMIVVTPFVYYDEIYKSISNKCDCPIVSIEDIIL